jgi:chemotaxis protein MotB
MARKHKHEDHVNHEAWAIPYGDLITLLLAFFVVMYAMSSVNEGKYRVLSDSLVAAFRGSPKTLTPIQVGEKSRGSGADIHMSIVQQAMLEGQPRELFQHIVEPQTGKQANSSKTDERTSEDEKGTISVKHTAEAEELDRVATQVEQAMADLIRQDLVVVRRHGIWVEVEIRTDILFPSGVARLTPSAAAVLMQLAQTLKPFPNPIRVEGHTDNRPISTAAYPSNWELSAARAASVVHLFMEQGLDPARLAVIGLGEYRPAQTNDTPEGRNANRRVVLVILGGNGMPEGPYGTERGESSQGGNSDAQPAAAPAQAMPPVVETVPQIVTPAAEVEAGSSL